MSLLALFVPHLVANAAVLPSTEASRAILPEALPAPVKLLPSLREATPEPTDAVNCEKDYFDASCGWCDQDPKRCEPQEFKPEIPEGLGEACEIKDGGATGCTPDGTSGSCLQGMCAIKDLASKSFECTQLDDPESSEFSCEHSAQCGVGQTCFGGTCATFCSSGTDWNSQPFPAATCHYYRPLGIALWLFPCNPLLEATDCSPGGSDKCVLASDEQGFVCVPNLDSDEAAWESSIPVVNDDLDGQQSGHCDSSDRCEAGSVCIAVPGDWKGCNSAQCRWYCDLNEKGNPCGKGYACKSFADVPGYKYVGACVPEWYGY